MAAEDLCSQSPPPFAFRRVLVEPRHRAWLTVGVERTVLVAVRTVTALTRLLDVVSLLASDHRVQVVFSHDEQRPAMLDAGVREQLDALGAPVIPWQQARESTFDLAIAASENDALHELTAPVLLVPHGLGFQKYYPGTTTVAGMDPDRLLHEGHAVPDVIALSHPEQRDWLPAALDRAVVLGDPGLDRLHASAHRAPLYRAALGTRDRTLVVLASTWGRDSLLGTWPTVADDLVAQLDADRYQVAAILHPGVWSAHGPWQVRNWLARAERGGLAVMPFDESWRAALLAADVVVTDHGSLGLYAAALDKPVVVATASASTVTGSPADALSRQARHLRNETALEPQLAAALTEHRQGAYQAIVDRAVARQGESAALLRATMYELMDLPEPVGEAAYPPVPEPAAVVGTASAYLASARVEGEVAAVSRVAAFAPRTQLEHRHVCADVRRASYTELSGASVLYVGELDPQMQLRQWPNASLAAVRRDAGTCLVYDRDGSTYTVTASEELPDPLVLASFVYVRQMRGADVTTLALGPRRVTVATETSRAC